MKLLDLWSKAEQIWEGVFSLLASMIILFMGIAFLEIDRARVKWRYKLSTSFESRQKGVDGGGKSGGRWALFLLPFVTVIREGLEAVVFVGGVSI